VCVHTHVLINPSSLPSYRGFERVDNELPLIGFTTHCFSSNVPQTCVEIRGHHSNTPNLHAHFLSPSSQPQYGHSLRG